LQGIYIYGLFRLWPSLTQTIQVAHKHTHTRPSQPRCYVTCMCCTTKPT